jgi:hypothetical protein
MRKLIAGLVLVVSTATGVAAQERQYGVKAGPAFSTTAIKPEEAGGYRWRNGGAAGVFYVRPLAPLVGLQVEALYVQKGGKLEDGRYSWGLTPVNRDRTGGFRVRTRVLAVTAGIRF